MARKSYIPGDFELVVKRSATGLGLFADGEIPKNACIIGCTDTMTLGPNFPTS